MMSTVPTRERIEKVSNTTSCWHAVEKAMILNSEKCYKGTLIEGIVSNVPHGDRREVPHEEVE